MHKLKFSAPLSKSRLRRRRSATSSPTTPRSPWKLTAVNAVPSLDPREPPSRNFSATPVLASTSTAPPTWSRSPGQSPQLPPPSLPSPPSSKPPARSLLWLLASARKLLNLATLSPVSSAAVARPFARSRPTLVLNSSSSTKPAAFLEPTTKLPPPRKLFRRFWTRRQNVRRTASAFRKSALLLQPPPLKRPPKKILKMSLAMTTSKTLLDGKYRRSPLRCRTNNNPESMNT
mmetsp:Transcript_47929/g.70973  ORF Transcript_47929/g.70973 Transcript_47929/m.70973 type:complete len:232 (-) Transcript_47929:259-954(-)